MTATSTTSARNNKSRRARSGGFTLLEVMAALAILTLTVVPILAAGSDHVRGIERSVQVRQVSLLARQKLVQLLSGEEDMDSGDFSEFGRDDVLWEVEWGEEAVGPLLTGHVEPLDVLLKVHLRVRYPVAGQDRQLDLVTYRRQVPAAAPPAEGGGP